MIEPLYTDLPEFRKHLDEYLAKVASLQQPLHVTDDPNNSFVVLSEEAYRTIYEEAYRQYVVREVAEGDASLARGERYEGDAARAYIDRLFVGSTI